MRTLLTVAQRKATDPYFRSVSLFPEDPWSKEVLEELERYMERFEVIVGDNVLERDVDKYSLGELDNPLERQGVQWD